MPNTAEPPTARLPRPQPLERTRREDINFAELPSRPGRGSKAGRESGADLPALAVTQPTAAGASDGDDKVTAGERCRLPYVPDGPQRYAALSSVSGLTDLWR